MSEALIVRDDAKLTISFTESAIALKQSALERAALIGKVENAETQEEAVAAQKELAGVVNVVNQAEEEAKRPLNRLRSEIIGGANKFRADLIFEQGRLAELVGSFQQLEQARTRAALQAENERLTALERERAAELAKAKNIEAIDEIQAKFNERAQAEAPPIEATTPVRANGQRVREDWEITVVNEWNLARAHPNCVKLTPLLSEIRNLLDAGVKVAGVSAKRVVKAGVTTGKVRQAIDV